MQDFTTYSYNINLSDIEKVLSNVINKGYEPLILINGEYYNIITSNEEGSDTYINGNKENNWWQYSR